MVDDDQIGAVALFFEFFNFNMVSQTHHKGEDRAKQPYRQLVAELQPFLLFFLFHGSTFFLLKARNRAKDTH